MDQRRYQGTVAILKMYLEAGDIRSDLYVVVNRKKNADGLKEDVEETEQEDDPYTVAKDKEDVSFEDSKAQLLTVDPNAEKQEPIEVELA